MRGFARENQGGIGLSVRSDDRDLGRIKRNLGGIDVEDQAGAGALGGVDLDGGGVGDRFLDGEDRACVDREGSGGSDAVGSAVAGDGHALRGDVADDGVIDHDIESGGVDGHAGLVADDDDLRAGLGGRNGILDRGERVDAVDELVAVDDDGPVFRGELGVDEEFAERVDDDGGRVLRVAVHAGVRTGELDRPGVHAAFGAHDFVGADQVADVDGDGRSAGGGEVAGNDEVRGVAHRDAAAERQAVFDIRIGLVREADFRAGIDGDVAGDRGAARHVHLGGRQVLDSSEGAGADEAGVDQVDIVQRQAAVLREDAVAAGGGVEVDVAGVLERAGAADRDVADRGDLAGVFQVAADDHAGGQDHIVVVHVAGRRNADLVDRGNVAQRADRAVVVDVLGFDQAGVDGALVQDVAVDHERILVGEGGLPFAACNVQGTARNVQFGEVRDGTDFRVAFDVQDAGGAFGAAVESAGHGCAVDQAVERGEHVVAEIGGVRRLAITEVRDRAAREGDFDFAADSRLFRDADGGELAAGKGQIHIAGDGIAVAADLEHFSGAARDVGVDLDDLVRVAADDDGLGVDGIIEGEGVDRGPRDAGTGEVGVDVGTRELDLGSVAFGVHVLDRVLAGQVGRNIARAAVHVFDLGVLDRHGAGGSGIVGELHVADVAVGDGDLDVRESSAGHVDGADSGFLVLAGMVDADSGGFRHVAEHDLTNIICIRGGHARRCDGGGGIADDEVESVEGDRSAFFADEARRVVLRHDVGREHVRIDRTVHAVEHDGGRFLVRDSGLRRRERGVALRAELGGLAVRVVAVDQQDRARSVVDGQVSAGNFIVAGEDTLGVFNIADVDDQIAGNAVIRKSGNEDGVGLGEFAGHIDVIDGADGADAHGGAESDGKRAFVAEESDAGGADVGAGIDRNGIPAGDRADLAQRLGRIEDQIEGRAGLIGSGVIAGHASGRGTGNLESLSTEDAVGGGSHSLSGIAVDRVVEPEVADRGSRDLDGGVGVNIVVFTGVVSREVAEHGVREGTGDGFLLIRGADKTFVDKGAAAVGRSADVEVDVAFDPAGSVPAGAAEAGAHVQAGELRVGGLEIDIAGGGVLAVFDLSVGRDVREHQEHVGEGRAIDRDVNIGFTLEVGAVNTGLDDAELALEQGVLDVGSEVGLFGSIARVNAAGEDDAIVGDGAAVDQEVDVAVNGAETDVAGVAFTHAVAGTVGDAEPLRHRLLEGEFVVAGESLGGIRLAAETHQVAAERGTFDVDVQRAVGIGKILIRDARRSGVVAALRVDDVGVIEHLAAIEAEEVIVAVASRGAAVEIRDENRFAVVGLNRGRVVVVGREIDEGVLVKHQRLTSNGTGATKRCDRILARVRRIGIDIAGLRELDESARLT